MTVNKLPLEAKKYVSYVSENVQLYDMFTARQDLAFFAEPASRKSFTKQDYDNVMWMVGLPERALRMRLKHFSKGMRQKLGIAIALLKDTPVIIMDELTSGLDPTSAQEFLAQLRWLREQGKASLMITHDIFRAKIIADRVGIMKHGRLVAIHENRILNICSPRRNLHPRNADHGNYLINQNSGNLTRAMKLFETNEELIPTIKSDCALWRMPIFVMVT